MDYKSIINKKIKHISLTYDEIMHMVNLFVSEKLCEVNMTLFLKAIYNSGLSFKETLYLTDIMIKSGETIDLSEINGKTVDKHSTGGVGDKTSLILLPICASLNVKVPKMSGKSLGITGGTVDKLESIPGFKSSLNHKKFIDIVNKVGCAGICQNQNICIADKKIYALRNKTGLVDSIPLIASSIMSKKIACSSKNIVIDLKVGNGAFMKNMQSAKRLAKLMIKIGAYYNRKVICVLTDMSIPLGTNVGNILEVKEAINFFEGKRDERLENLIICLSSHMVSITKNISYKKAEFEVLKVLNNNDAKNKFYEWIKAQSGNINKLKMNAKRIDVKSVENGFINKINANIIGEVATELSSNNKKLDPSAGIVLRKKIGEYVNKGEVIASIYYNNELENMISKVISAFEFTKREPKYKDIILKVIK